jgi:hypothetical protein
MSPALRWPALVALTLATSCSRAPTLTPPAPRPPAARGQAFIDPSSLPVTFEVVPIIDPPLIAAITGGDVARARELLESGTDPNVRSEKVNPGTPAIAMAIELVTDGDDQFAASRELLGLLLQHGANPNIRWCGPDGDVVAPLVADSRRPDPQPVPPRTPRPPSPCTQTNGVTPLMFASLLGSESASVLMRYGADSSLRDWRGYTAADYRGVKSGSASLCAMPPRGSQVVMDADLLARGDRYWGEPGNRVFAAVGPLPGPNARLTASTDERVCEAAARAVAQYHTPPDGLAPRQILPVIAIRVGRAWVVGRPDSIELGVFDAGWRLIDWSDGPS